MKIIDTSLLQWPKRCMECSKAAQFLIELGEPSFQDSNTTWLCPDCIDEAHRLAASRVSSVARAVVGTSQSSRIAKESCAFSGTVSTASLGVSFLTTLNQRHPYENPRERRRKH